MANHAVNEAIESILKISKEPNGDVTTDKQATYRLLLASRKLNAALEPPAEMAMSAAFSGVLMTCIRLAIELGVFEKIASSNRPATSKGIAAERGADEGLVSSILRILVAKGFIAETTTSDGSKAYTSTPMTRHMTQPSVRAGLIFHYDSGLPLLSQALSYYRSTNFRLPQGHGPGLFQYAHNTADSDYVYWSKQPGVMENFNTFMQGYFGGDVQPVPVGWFPYDKVCLEGFDANKSEYLYVDVGGGLGQNLQGILEIYGNVAKGGRWILQDLPPVIEDVEKSGMTLDKRIEKFGYDYFTPQPIRGARTYSLDNIFHNHNDDQSKEILAVVKEAMEPGYSKLLISTMILPDSGAPFAMCAMDIMVSCINSGKERTASEWKTLLEGCGFRIVKFWYPPGPGNGVIVAEIAGRE